MSVIHYKSPLCGVTTVCGRGLHKLSTSYTEKPEGVTCLRCAKHSDVIKARRPVADKPQASLRPPRIVFEIESQAAWALAQFCKRSTFETFAQCAQGKDDAYQMRDALHVVYEALRDAGFDPR